jgi:hypothetical protein
MAAHAKLSASGSHRWLACPASVKAEEGLPEGVNVSVYANEGTSAHELAEIVLRSGGECDEWAGKKLPETHWPVDYIMAEYVQEYVNFVRHHCHKDAFSAFEVRVDFSAWVPEGFGTCDALIIDGDLMHVIDLKYGKGVPVSPVKNSQGMLYALGAYSDYGDLAEIKRVRITIAQPRIGDGAPQSWDIDLADLLKWGEWVKQRAEACFEPNAEFVPGEKQCQWCKAKVTCKALADLTTQTLMADFDDIGDAGDLQPVDRLTDEQIANVLRVKKLVGSWLDAVEAHVVERLNEGQSFPGYKLVAGRSNRQWSDETQAEATLTELLAEKAFTQKLLSPAQAEKALGKKRASEIASLVSKGQGAPTLAPVDDPRPAVNVSVDDF